MTIKGRVHLVVVEVVWPSLLAVGGHVVIHNKHIRLSKNTFDISKYLVSGYGGGAQLASW